MLPKQSPKIFRWPGMCPLGKILAQDFEIAALTKILGRRAVLPDNASLSLGKWLHFRGPTLPVIAVTTSEVGPAVLLSVEEVCEVLRSQTNSVPRYH